MNRLTGYLQARAERQYVTYFATLHYWRYFSGQAYKRRHAL